MAPALSKWIERYDARGVIVAKPFSDVAFRHELLSAEYHNLQQPRVGQAPGRQYVRVVEREGA